MKGDRSTLSPFNTYKGRSFSVKMIYRLLAFDENHIQITVMGYSHVQIVAPFGYKQVVDQSTGCNGCKFDMFQFYSYTHLSSLRTNGFKAYLLIA